MPHSQNRISLKRALGASTLLHVLLGPLLIAGPTLALGEALSRDTGPTETTRVSYLRLERQRPRPRVIAARRAPLVARITRPASTESNVARPRVALAVQRRREAPRTPSLVRSATATAADVAKPGDVALERSRQTIAQPDESREPTGDSAPQPVEAAPTETPTPAVATPAPARVVEASARGIDVPPGGWGQSFERPLVVDETALSELRAHYHAASTVTIEVDETGHAIRISLPAGLADDVRAELEKRLRELRYVPAECNGLRCTGTLQVLL